MMTGAFDRPSIDSAQIAAITEFATSYEHGPESRRLSQQEQRLLCDALTDYLCHGQWRQPSGGECAAIVRAIEHLLRVTPAGPVHSVLTTSRDALIRLVGDLGRREHAYDLMREHLTLLSEANRQLRAKLSEPPGSAARAGRGNPPTNGDTDEPSAI